ncbi:GreA/GreB family elongation factor [Povalibacter sp.]|uniref:GreA/GreB family elongation factor n=1 Tax=Povalibacter sp. TaxID=1962978 RepID=UPI002F3FD0D7
MRERPIVITNTDAGVLRSLLAAGRAKMRDQDHLDKLELELERAFLIDAQDVPPTVVTMHRRISVLDLSTGTRQELMLVGPSEADVTARKISVLAPLGTALLGYSEGDELEWQMPGGLRRLRIEKVMETDAVDAAVAH